MVTASQIWPIVIAWSREEEPTPGQRQLLKEHEIFSPSGHTSGHTSRQNIWRLSEATVDLAIEHRAALLQDLCQKLQTGVAFPLPGPWTDWVAPLWTLWLPLALDIHQQQKTLGQPFIQGILGGQGTGKTTLTLVLQLILSCLGNQTVSLSIDDLYLTYDERLALRQQDPRLIWRGPPGTHDVALGVDTLSALKRAEPGVTVSVPQFDKSLHQGQGDRTQPIQIEAPTVVLFEGWFVGVDPLSETLLADPTFAFPAPIETAADRQFAKDCNTRLADYQALWSFLDSLIVLKPADYRFSLAWRQQAEQQMIASGKSGLSDSEIVDFVTYFWKALHPQLFIEPLARSQSTRLVVNIRPDHTLGELQLPAR
ncbi:MAG: glycerate kinase [Cyanobacteria bacterium J06554_11]